MSSKITIIGAGSVGSTIAYTLAHDEIASEIVLIDINKEKAEETAHEVAACGVRSLALAADVTSVEDVDRIVEAVVGDFGRLDVAFNNAGIASNLPSLTIVSSQYPRLSILRSSGCPHCCSLRPGECFSLFHGAALGCTQRNKSRNPPGFRSAFHRCFR